MRPAVLLAWIALCLTATRADAALDVREETLPNGLKVLLAPDPLAAGVDVGVWYRAGTRFERAGQRGATHLLERMMFRGSKRYAAGEHVRRIRAEGGAANTFLSPDFVCLYETVPPSALKLALDLESDRMAGPRLLAASLAAEKRTASDEQRRRESLPAGAGLERLFAAAYGDHPYAAPANGRARERDAITLAQLTSYANARLSPGNALLTIVGRFDADSALAAARRAFGAIPARGAVSEPEPPPPAAQGERRGVARVASPVALVLCGWRAPGGSDSSRVALRVLSRMLTDGPTAAFSRALVQRKDPLLVGVQGDVDVRRDGSLLYLFAPVRPGLDSSAVESALALEAERFARDSVEADEVERAKKAIEIEWLTARQTSRGRAAALGEAMLQSGDWREADRDLERLRALDARVVQRLAQQVLRSENSVTVWVWPLSAPGGEASR